MIPVFSKIRILKFISCQWRECWNDLLHMKLEEHLHNYDSVDGILCNKVKLLKIFSVGKITSGFFSLITHTHPCNIQQYFTAVKMLIF